MTRPLLLFLHGWAFDRTLWDKLCEQLPDFACIRWDRGYFGPPVEPSVAPPLIAVGHSLGALLLAQCLPADTPLVVINGFDRFTGPNGVAARVLDHMRRRFAAMPDVVLNEFRSRCGAPPAPEFMDKHRLGGDLTLLATERAAPAPRRVLVLHGDADPILPPALRDSVFPSAKRATLPQGGHLLPSTHAAWCADNIRSFVWG
jgi:pimeloyl-[acyl-carrier protein] methyl ester esterase